MSAEFRRVDAYWALFAGSTGEDPTRVPPTTSFGDTPAMQDELCSLVLRGIKRATTSLARCYESGGEVQPSVGQHGIVLDGSGVPRAIILTVEVQIKPFSAVDESFALREGEGDGGLRHWREVHRAFFSREAHTHGFIFDEADLVVLESFDMVWPRTMADSET